MEQKKFDSGTLTGAAVHVFSALLIMLIMGMSSYNAYSAMLYLRPDDQVRAWSAPALYDAAILVYLAEFAFAARGGHQRLFALIGLVLSTIGAIAMNALYLDVTSYGALYSDATIAQMSQWLLRSFEAAIGVHLVLHICMILFAPSIIQSMKDQAALWRIMSRASEVRDSKVDEIVEVTADRMADKSRNDVLGMLSVKTGLDLSDIAPAPRYDARRSGKVIEAAPAPATAFASETPMVRRFAVGAPPRAREGDDIVRAHLSEYHHLMDDMELTPQEARQFILEKYTETPGAKNVVVRSEIRGDLEYLWYADGSTGVRGVGGKPVASATVTTGGEDAEKA